MFFLGNIIKLMISVILGGIIFTYLNRMIVILPEGIEEEELSKEERKALNQKKRKQLLAFHSPDMPHGFRYRSIQVLGAVLGMIICLFYGWSLEGLTIFFVYAILTVIAMIDADTQYIPPELNVTLLILGIISIWTIPGPTLVERLIGVVCVSVPLLLITLVIAEAFGGGDIKMMAAVGFLLGWKGCVAAFMIGLLLGGAYGVFVLLAKKKGRKEHFAFGPFLAIGIAIALFEGFGAKFITVYIQYVAAAFQPY